MDLKSVPSAAGKRCFLSGQTVMLSICLTAIVRKTMLKLALIALAVVIVIAVSLYLYIAKSFKDMEREGVEFTTIPEDINDNHDVKQD